VVSRLPGTRSRLELCRAFSEADHLSGRSSTRARALQEDAATAHRPAAAGDPWNDAQRPHRKCLPADAITPTSAPERLQIGRRGADSGSSWHSLPSGIWMKSAMRSATAQCYDGVLDVLRFDRSPLAANPHFCERLGWPRMNDDSPRIELQGEYDLANKDALAALFGSLRVDGPDSGRHDEGHVYRLYVSAGNS